MDSTKIWNTSNQEKNPNKINILSMCVASEATVDQIDLEQISSRFTTISSTMHCSSDGPGEGHRK